MRFRYFEGPRTEMRGALKTPEKCSYCGVTAADVFRSGERTPVGCYSCLRAGRFGFFQLTDAGYVDASGLRVEFEEADRRIEFLRGANGAITARTILGREALTTVTPEAAYELWRTPDFPTWNEVRWPVHCREFMTYLGEWKPAKFESRNQFLAMTDKRHHILWPAETRPAAWGVTYYGFKCPTCGAMTGRVDFS